MWAFSQDLRERVVQAYDRKVGSQREIAGLFNVSIPFVEKLLQRRRATGNVRSLPHKSGHRRILSEGDQKALREMVKREPDATLQELCEAMHEKRGVKVSVSTMSVELRRLGLGVKKRASMRRRGTLPGSRRPGRPLQRAF